MFLPMTRYLQARDNITGFGSFSSHPSKRFGFLPCKTTSISCSWSIDTI